MLNLEEENRKRIQQYRQQIVEDTFMNKKQDYKMVKDSTISDSFLSNQLPSGVHHSYDLHDQNKQRAKTTTTIVSIKKLITLKGSNLRKNASSTATKKESRASKMQKIECTLNQSKRQNKTYIERSIELLNDSSRNHHNKSILCDCLRGQDFFDYQETRYLQKDVDLNRNKYECQTVVNKMQKI